MFIDIKGAKKIYGKKENQVNALDGVDLELDEGGIYIILGPSGSGKSTLLNMLGGLDSLDEGKLSVGGVSIGGMKDKELVEYRRSDVGFVFQFYNLIPDLTVKENIQVVADITENPLNIDEVMEAVDIKKYENHFPAELSGGQQQRVSIARAIIKNPKLLLCDELTGALDTKSARLVLKFVENVNERFNTTTVIITHNEAIAKMGDAVIRIKDGRVISNKVNENKIPAQKLEM
ncbi:MAG: ABC transporter ATP-binding protein [Eubacterium sp.]|nr:ABC transporter ATP-binding protein [Eubacterium sp.]